MIEGQINGRRVEQYRTAEHKLKLSFQNRYMLLFSSNLSIRSNK